MNPWHDVSMPEDAIEPGQTQHYTLEEAEDMISALLDHLDCQLIVALSCFLGLRPGEIAALKWEDFDSESVRIRRSVVRGIVDTPKTPESMAELPLVGDHILIPLELWRQKSDYPENGWAFPSQNGTPVDLHNLLARVIVPFRTSMARTNAFDARDATENLSSLGRVFMPEDAELARWLSSGQARPNLPKPCYGTSR